MGDWSIADPLPRASLPGQVRLTAAGLVYFARELRSTYRGIDSIERRRDRRVRAIAAHAHRSVPFFRRAMDEVGISPEQIRTAADLAWLPIVEREQFQAEPELFRDPDRDGSRCATFRTGGSTGQPVTVVYSLRDIFEQGRGAWRIRAVSVELGAPRLRRRVAYILPPRSSAEKFRDSAALNSVLARVDPRTIELALSASDDLTTVIRRLNEFRPHVIITYGSVAEEMVATAGRAGLSIYPAKALVYGADGISPGARRAWSEDLGIPVLSAYNAVEMPQVAFECAEHTGMHVNVDLCAPRIIDDDGRVILDETPGQLIVSNLLCRTTVLLNYRLGDIAHWVGEPCPCGRALPLIALDTHRAGSYFTDLAGRRIVGQLAERAFSSRAAVLGYQLEQNEPASITARVVAAGEPGRAGLEHAIRTAYAELVGENPALRIEWVDRLPRTEAGKVCRVAPGLTPRSAP